MIAPDRTRAELLAEIGATDTGTDSLTDMTDPRFATSDVHVRVCGHAKEDLFPLLDLALSERFAALPRARLLRDVLIPVRKALGNAHKHGNGKDPAKDIVVEIVLTRHGVVIAITDEGPGFDVARTFQRFRERQKYFVHQGAGFRFLHRAMSTVSYEHGGRTLLLCYRQTDDLYDGAPSCSDRQNLLDSQWMQTCLSAELPEFRTGRARLASCRVYLSHGRDDFGPRYVLQVVQHDGAVETRILTARLHASEAIAQADFEAASHLYDSCVLTRVRVPRPVARLDAEPCLVLYEFVPSMNLSEYFAYRGNLSAVRHALERIGQTMAALHRSPAVLPDVESGIADEPVQARIARADATLRTLSSSADLVNRFQCSIRCMNDRTGSRMWRAMAPIHGSLRWDCIYYGVDGRFYLYRFEKCRRSDPGLDLGGFAADLLCYTLDHYDDQAYRVCRDELLKHYNAEAEHRTGEDDLRIYTVLALCERLQLAQLGSESAVEHLVMALAAALREEPSKRDAD
ncbi:MAG: ATP-binding protein [Candidatus Eisenbacteria bacterium]|uniref:ATP-binding protein n=1 Tax=Eiseniibacteriota bacterium TaxID=2212470 RepID=A0A538S8S1_UNCEI|nr:MAG: ATP-binding protein [Candidatus Eisenbacteria bacterium]